MTFDEWCARWAYVVPVEAIGELMTLVNPTAHHTGDSDPSESKLQAEICLVAARDYRVALWRNNNGAVTTDDGRHIRFGLGNQSAQLNKAWKSSDLIGLRRTDGRFVAVEVKKPGWRLVPSDKRGHAQKSFHETVRLNGGVAGFAQSVEDFRGMMTG